MNKKNKTTEQKEEKQITVKSIVAALSSGIVDDPNRLSGYLILLTANLWVYGRDKIEAEAKHAEKWGEIRASCDTDGQADKRAKLTEEWKAWQMATAMASASSALTGLGRFASIVTISATWCFSARPYPVTYCLTVAGG